jgi:phage repressor protein C with HTH and peptisase S24 domain
MDALERSKRYIEAISIIMQEEGMTKDADLASVIGVERSIIPKVRKGRQSASIELIVKTYIAYPKINTDYILTGRGLMFNQEQKPNEVNDKIESNARPLGAGITILVPLVNQYAYAGYLSGYQDETYLGTLPTIPFTVDHEARGSYVAFEVKGDSMNDGTEESYLEGDRLLCREVQPHLWVDSKLHIRKWDFVIVHEEGILVKRIIDHDVKNHTITVHSLNDFYPDRVIDLAEVRQIFNVVEMQRPKRR